MKKRRRNQILPDSEEEANLAPFTAFPNKKISQSLENDEYEHMDDIDNAEYEEEEVYNEEYDESKQLTKSEPNHKYWGQRFRLFSKFSEGIELDEEGWFSVTPELIAKHVARRIWRSLSKPINDSSVSKDVDHIEEEDGDVVRPGIIFDAFCGPGGNTIQFACEAHPSSIVFAVDIDPNKIALAKNNAKVYNVADRIEFIIGDSLKLSPGFRADAVFLSPPWGGPSYLNTKSYDLDNIKPIAGKEMYKITKTISPNIAMLLPRNVNNAQVIQLADQGQDVELEANYLSGKVKTLTAYFGSLVKTTEEAEEEDGDSILVPIPISSPTDIDPFDEFIPN